MKNQKVLMIFIDGIGIGKADPSINPFFNHKFKFIHNFFDNIHSLDNPVQIKNNRYIFPVDAVMGVEGLPQSGTGQVSIFCGINAQKQLGMHFGPFPHSELHPVLKEKNIFKILQDKGRKVTFANAYPSIFFDYINSGKKRLSVTSKSCLESGVPLKNYNDLKKGKALAADINNNKWVSQLNYELPVIQASTAAKRLIKLALENDYTLYEYFATDYLGHGRNADQFDYTINLFDSFIYSILKYLPEEISLIICSDHGNLEDMSVKTHTTNPSFTLSAGEHSKLFYNNVKNLADIYHVIVEILMK